MPVEYRPVTADELRQFTYNSNLGFGNSTADAEVDRMLAREFLKPEWTRAAVVDGEIGAQMASIPFTMRWNRRDIAVGGVTAVSTLPSHRRQGHLRRLMGDEFAAMRAEKNQPVAMLWASMAAIYQRFGYGIAYTRYASLGFDPRTVKFIDEIPTPGQMRFVKGEEAITRIRPVYERFIAGRSLAFNRTDPWWNQAWAQPWRPDMAPFLFAVYEESGEALGYVKYQVAQHGPPRFGPDQKVSVSEVGWLTPAAHRAIWRMVLGYDLADTIEVGRMPVDDPLFDQVQEPRLLQLNVVDGTLVRIVDLAKALEGRGYDADGRLRFFLADDLCPWNTGAWELSVEGGQARVQPSDAATDLQLTPRTLAILASGRERATRLAAMGLLPSSDAASLTTADALFGTAQAPVCLDGF